MLVVTFISVLFQPRLVKLTTNLIESHIPFPCKGCNVILGIGQAVKGFVNFTTDKHQVQTITFHNFK